ncbi:hypothetical protein DID78_06780 [Candidatus Marinamargulisbacteria bacterium SCGC AG-343-D04]|nr:hypothetical protein DID78_06780 [Candidatus Marinamargulisbacteria bacterium SCGC AG-343-D04]
MKVKNYLLASLLVLLVAGCGDAKKLKNVDDITIVGLSFSKHYVTFNKDGEKEGPGLNVLKAGSKMLKKKDAAEILEIEIDEESREFYLNTYEGILNIFKKHGFTIKDARNLSDTTPLSKLSARQDTKFNRLTDTYFSPEPFASAKYAQKKAVMAEVANDIKTDAVGTIKIELVKKPKRKMLMKGFQMGLRVQMGMWTNNAEVIFGQGWVHTFYSDAAIDWGQFLPGNMGDYIDITPKNQKQFDQIRAEFLADLDQKLSKALAK